MKHFFLLLLLSISFLNCTNDDETLEDPEITGNWIWIESTGGIDGRTDTPTSTGNQIKLEISKNTITRITNGVITSQLTYSIETKESILFGEQREMIVFENDFNQTFELTQTQLILVDECTDCFRNVYIKE